MENRLHHLRNDRLFTTLKEMNEETKLVRMSRLIFGRRKNNSNNNNSNSYNQNTFTLKGKTDQQRSTFDDNNHDVGRRSVN